MHLEFFATAIGFYVALATISLILSALLENEHPRFSALCLVVLFWYLAWIKIFDVLAYVRDNPLYAVFWVVGYFAAGAASLYPKWYGFVSDELEKQASYIEHGRSLEGRLTAPRPGDYKEQIMAWAVYWPWSMLWFMVRHPLRRIGRAIYDGMEASLARISESMTARMKLKLEAQSKKKSTASR